MSILLMVKIVSKLIFVVVLFLFCITSIKNERKMKTLLVVLFILLFLLFLLQGGPNSWATSFKLS